MLKWFGSHSENTGVFLMQEDIKALMGNNRLSPGIIGKLGKDHIISGYGVVASI